VIVESADPDDLTTNIGGLVGEYRGHVDYCEALNDVSLQSGGRLGIGGFMGVRAGVRPWSRVIGSNCRSVGIVSVGGDVSLPEYTIDRYGKFMDSGVGGFIGVNAASIRYSYTNTEVDVPQSLLDEYPNKIGAFYGNSPDIDGLDDRSGIEFFGGSVAEACYWNRDRTDLPAIPYLQNGRNDGDFTGSIQYLTSDEISGESAADSMIYVGFEHTWAPGPNGPVSTRTSNVDNDKILYSSSQNIVNTIDSTGTRRVDNE
jgi:hypothetical protein